VRLSAESFVNLFAVLIIGVPTGIQCWRDPLFDPTPRVAAIAAIMATTRALPTEKIDDALHRRTDDP
jgi:hypothetical protein